MQRCLENGDSETGVSILYSVLKMDAGPIVSQLKVPLKGMEKSPELLNSLFQLGAEELVRILPFVFDKTVTMIEQNEDDATLAPKLSSNDSFLDFSKLTATQCHNRCRGYAGWPGTWTYFKMSGSEELVRVKIITTTLLDANERRDSFSRDIIPGKVGNADILRVTCADGSSLGILELQPANKKEMNVKAFINGLRGASIEYSCFQPTGSSTASQ